MWVWNPDHVSDYVNWLQPIPVLHLCPLKQTGISVHQRATCEYIETTMAYIYLHNEVVMWVGH